MAANPLVPTPLAALQFAVDFAQMDLATVSPRDLQRIARQLDRLLNPDRPTTWAQLPTLDRPALVAMQTALLRFLTQFVTRGAVKAHLRLDYWVVRQLRPGVQPSSRRKPDPRAYVSEVDVIVSGEPTDRLL